MIERFLKVLLKKCLIQKSIISVKMSRKIIEFVFRSFLSIKQFHYGCILTNWSKYDNQFLFIYYNNKLHFYCYFHDFFLSSKEVRL